MKRLFIAAALVGAAVLPATAGAVPLGGAACMAFGGAPGQTSSCNFTGAANGLGYVGGSSSGGYTLTHIAKTVVCSAGKVSGYAAVVKTDAQKGTGTSYSGYDFSGGPGYSFVVGRVYTFTILGQGWGMIGGPSTPTPSVPAEPATPSSSNWAGSEDATGGLAIGAAC